MSDTLDILKRNYLMEEKVLDILEKICGTDEVKQNKDIHLFDEGILDSLGFIELLVDLEEKLDVKIDT